MLSVAFDPVDPDPWKLSIQVDDDPGSPTWWPAEMFRTIDATIPSNWVIQLWPDGSRHTAPEAWLRPGFWEDFFDRRDISVIETFAREFAVIARESRAVPDGIPFYAAVGDALLAGDKRVDHIFIVNSAGSHAARDVYVWLAYGDTGEVRRTDERHLGLLGAGDERRVEIQESDFLGGCVSRDGLLMCRWTDGLGTHTERLLEVTVYL